MATPDLRQELASLQPSSIIELYELNTQAKLHGVDKTWRFSSTVNATYGMNTIVWNGNIYWPFPIQAEGFSYNGKGALPRPTVRVGNAEGAITAILTEVNQHTAGNDLQGAEFRRVRTLARFLDHENFEGGENPYGTPDPLSTFPEEVYYVDQKTLECRDYVEFSLAARYDLAGIQGPKRQALKRCTWAYRGDGCGYNGNNYYDENNDRVDALSNDICGKTLRSCRLRFGSRALLPFGGFPGLGNYQF
jgi:lambda family phage minor tail protein L